MKTTKFRFNFFNINSILIDGDKKNKEEIPCDLTDFFHALSKVECKKTTQPYDGDMIRLQKIQFDSLNNIFELQLIRLRVKVLPGIADTDGNFEIITLNDKEYYAESTTAIYDTNNKFFILQSNYYAISPTIIQKYFRKLLNGQVENIVLRPLFKSHEIDTIALAKRINNFSTKIKISEAPKKTPIKSLTQVIKSFGDLGTKDAKFTLFSSRSKKQDGLSEEDILDLVRYLYETNYTESLSVSIVDENNNTRLIDLLDDREHFEIDISFSKKNPVTHEKLYAILISDYLLLNKPSNKIIT